MKKQGCWKFSNQFYWMKSRRKSEKALLGAGQHEQQATDVPEELLIASLVQTQLLQPLQTRSVQVPRLLHIFINQTKPTQSGFFSYILILIGGQEPSEFIIGENGI